MAKKRQLTDDEKKQVREIQKSKDGILRCYISGEIINDSDEIEFDHIVPYSSDGPSDVNNERIVKKKYNREKGALSLIEYKNFYSLKVLFETNNNKVKLQDIYNFKNIQIESIAVVENQNEIVIKGTSQEISVPKYIDAKLSIPYFYAQLPTSWISNDDQQGLQPRVIDLKRLWKIKNHLIEHPQLAPSIARLINNEIKLFDGQHKLAAQLLNDQKYVDVKIYISPSDPRLEKIVYENLLKTNLTAHTELKQVEFFTNTLFQKWNEMQKIKWEEYLDANPTPPHTETKFFEYLKNIVGKTDATKMFEATIIKNAFDNSELERFTAVSNKNASLPLSQDLLKKSLFKYLLYTSPNNLEIDSSDDYRDAEIENFNIISNIIVDKGYLNNWTSSKKNISEEQRKARRIWTKASLISWSPMVSDMINIIFQLVMDEDRSKRLLRTEMTDKQKKMFENYFERLFNHPFWSQNDEAIDKALGSATSLKGIFEKQGLNSSYVMKIK